MINAIISVTLVLLNSSFNNTSVDDIIDFIKDTNFYTRNLTEYIGEKMRPVCFRACNFINIDHIYTKFGKKSLHSQQ